jgi:hypothetical protein
LHKDSLAFVCDYMHTNPRRAPGRCLTIGNPPFGKNATLAVQFFARAALFSDTIAFVLPRTFLKQTILARLPANFKLRAQRDIPGMGFDFEGKPATVPAVFQVWTHELSHNAKATPPAAAKFECADFAFVQPGQPCDIIIRRVGVLAGRIYMSEADLARWTTLNHFFLRVRDRDNPAAVSRVVANLCALNLEQLPCKYATAGMPSISKSELCREYQQRFQT